MLQAILVFLKERESGEEKIFPGSASGVFDGARERPQHAERVPGIRRRPVRHAARRGPQADHIAEIARIAQGGGEIAAIGEGQHAGRHGRGRATRGAAGALAEVVGIERGAEHHVEGVAAGREFRQVGLAEGDRARRRQPLDDEVVLLGHVVPVYRRAESGPDAARRYVVLVGDRQSREGTDRRLFSIQFPSFL